MLRPKASEGDSGFVRTLYGLQPLDGKFVYACMDENTGRVLTCEPLDPLGPASQHCVDYPVDTEGVRDDVGGVFGHPWSV